MAETKMFWGVLFTRIEKLSDIPREVQESVQHDVLDRRVIAESLWVSEEGQLFLVAYPDFEQYYIKRKGHWTKFLDTKDELLSAPKETQQ